MNTKNAGSIYTYIHRNQLDSDVHVVVMDTDGTLLATWQFTGNHPATRQSDTWIRQYVLEKLVDEIAEDSNVR